VNKVRAPFSQGEWSEKKSKLLEYLRNNPTASEKDLMKAGHGSALSKFYHGRINEARIEAFLPSKLKEIAIEILRNWKVEEEFISEATNRALSSFPKLRKLAGRMPIKNFLEECCYLACRQIGIPVPHKPSKVYYKIFRELAGIPIGHPERYVPIISRRLLFDKEEEKKITELTIEILNKLPKNSLMGKSETVIAATAVSLASIQLGYRRSQREISNAACITEVSLRNAQKKLGKLLGLQPKLKELSPLKWEERRAKLLEYLAKNPEATLRDLIRAGYKTTLMKFYHGRINEAKVEAGVDKKYLFKKRPRRFFIKFF
jgi:hypothetical protein